MQKKRITTRRHRMPTALPFVAAVAAIGGLVFGYDTGVIAGALPLLRRDLGLDGLPPVRIAVAVALGALGGALAAGLLADRVGRRATNVAAGALFVAGALLGAFAAGVQTLIAARVVMGLAIGVTAVAAPMYVAELAPARSRGGLVSIFPLAIAIGGLLALAAHAGLAGAGAWRWMLGLAALPGALLLLGMLRLPESPRWLARRGRTAAARTVLARVRPPGAVEGELAAIAADVAYDRKAPWSELLAPSVRPALVAGVGLGVLQQLAGLPVVLDAAPGLLEQAGYAPARAALGATLGIGVVGVLATLVAVALADRAGRRPLLLVGLGGMTASLVALGLASRGAAGTGGGAVVVAGLGGYVGLFAVALGTMVWLVIAEIHPTRVRAQAIAVATASLWGANALTTLAFPSVRQALGTGPTFWLLAVVGAAGLVFVWRYVPEAKDRSLEEMERVWVRHRLSR